MQARQTRIRQSPQRQNSNKPENSTKKPDQQDITAASTETNQTTSISEEKSTVHETNATATVATNANATQNEFRETQNQAEPHKARAKQPESQRAGQAYRKKTTQNQAKTQRTPPKLPSNTLPSKAKAAKAAKTPWPPPTAPKSKPEDLHPIGQNTLLRPSPQRATKILNRNEMLKQAGLKLPARANKTNAQDAKGVPTSIPTPPTAPSVPTPLPKATLKRVQPVTTKAIEFHPMKHTSYRAYRKPNNIDFQASREQAKLRMKQFTQNQGPQTLGVQRTRELERKFELLLHFLR